MDLHVGWNILDDTCERYKPSSITNIIVPRLAIKTMLQDLPVETSDESFENTEMGI